jgi:aspartate aminotransferase
MGFLSERVDRINESKTIAMTKLGREYAAKGYDIISLSIGEPDFDTPEYIRSAAVEALDQGYTHYTPVAGFPELKEAIQNKFKRDNNLDFNTDQIVVSTGAKHSIMNVMLSIINPGDEVIVPTPYWVSYVDMIKYAEGVPVLLETSVDTEYIPSIDQFKNAISDKTKAVIFSSPCNPSGSVYPNELLMQMADLMSDYPNVVIISDEIYEHINYTEGHYSIGSLEKVKDQVVTVNGLSKGFAMTGWRIGYIGAPVEIAKACEKLQGQFTSGTNSIAQRAAIVALGDNLDPTREMKAKFLERREMAVDFLSKVEGVKMSTPKGAFYVFPDISYFFNKSYNGTTIANSDDLSMYLLENAHVTVVSGAAFGMPKCIRISYAVENTRLLEALERIKLALEKLA